LVLFLKKNSLFFEKRSKNFCLILPADAAGFTQPMC